MGRLLIFGLLPALLTGCGQSVRPAPLPPSSMPEKVQFTTSDGVTIVGTYTPGSAPKAVLLLHMLPATKESWDPIVPRLVAAGFHTLAIDLRGHGESRVRGDEAIDYREFSDAEHQASRKDVDAALVWLQAKGITQDKIGVVGASIGANLALDALSRYVRLPTAVLLSAGLNYRGIETRPAARNLRLGQSVFFVGGEGDIQGTESAADMANTIATDLPGAARREVVRWGDSEHGTNLFRPHPELLTKIVQWLQSTIR